MTVNGICQVRPQNTEIMKLMKMLVTTNKQHRDYLPIWINPENQIFQLQFSIILTNLTNQGKKSLLILRYRKMLKIQENRVIMTINISNLRQDHFLNKKTALMVKFNH